MNESDAMRAMGNKTPVVYTTTGELGLIEKIWPDTDRAFVLYFGSRLAKVTNLPDLVAVDNLAASSGGVMYELHRAGKVHGGQMTERTFDWRPRFDERSRNYPIRALLPQATRPRGRALWKPGWILDQGSEGACVGFGWTGEALMSPVRVSTADMVRRLNLASTAPDDGNSVASDIYHQARREDEWPGEDYSGTSVLAGAKVMSALGYLREYRWCFGITDVVDTLIAHGPVVLGIEWHRSMYYPDAYGEVHVGGDVVGGHCIVASGYHPDKALTPGGPGSAMVQLTNSWGENWGLKGQAWIAVPELAGLLEAGGEACVPVHRSYGDRAYHIEGPL